MTTKYEQNPKYNSVSTNEEYVIRKQTRNSQRNTWKSSILLTHKLNEKRNEDVNKQNQPTIKH